MVRLVADLGKSVECFSDGHCMHSLLLRQAGSVKRVAYRTHYK